MKNQRNQNCRTNRKTKRKRSTDGGDDDHEDDARLLRELERKRAKLEEEISFQQKLVGKASKAIIEIEKSLKEGTLKPERLEFKKRVYNDYVRLLPETEKSVANLKLEFDTCSSLILEVESSLEERCSLSDSNHKCTPAAVVAVSAPGTAAVDADVIYVK